MSIDGSSFVVDDDHKQRDHSMLSFRRVCHLLAHFEGTNGDHSGEVHKHAVHGGSSDYSLCFLLL